MDEYSVLVGGQGYWIPKNIYGSCGSFFGRKQSDDENVCHDPQGVCVWHRLQYVTGICMWIMGPVSFFGDPATHITQTHKRGPRTCEKVHRTVTLYTRDALLYWRELTGSLADTTPTCVLV